MEYAKELWEQAKAAGFVKEDEAEADETQEKAEPEKAEEK
jgi:hypothetical protein